MMSETRRGRDLFLSAARMLCVDRLGAPSGLNELALIGQGDTRYNEDEVTRQRSRPGVAGLPQA